MTTRVTEVTSFSRTWGLSHEETVRKLVHLGWVVEEETPTSTTLSHELIPGGKRIVETV